MRGDAGAALARLGRRVRVLALACAVLTASCVTHGPSSALHSRAAATLATPAQARAVTVVGMTVADIERSTAFFTRVLDFEKVDDVEVSGPDYDQLWGLPGVRARIVRLRLGGQELELAEYGPRNGRPYPADSRSNDRWFQHVAIVVADMDAAYTRIRSQVSPISIGGPQTLPATNVAAAGISAFYFRDVGRDRNPPGESRVVERLDLNHPCADTSVNRLRQRTPVAPVPSRLSPRPPT